MLRRSHIIILFSGAVNPILETGITPGARPGVADPGPGERPRSIAAAAKWRSAANESQISMNHLGLRLCPPRNPGNSGERAASLSRLGPGRNEMSPIKSQEGLNHGGSGWLGRLGRLKATNAKPTNRGSCNGTIRPPKPGSRPPRGQTSPRSVGGKRRPRRRNPRISCRSRCATTRHPPPMEGLP